MSAPKFNFTSKYDYIKSLQNTFGLDDEECNAFLWILSMWDAKEELPEPTDFKLNEINNVSTRTKG